MPDSETMRSRFVERRDAHHGGRHHAGLQLCRCCGAKWPCADFVANTRNLHDLNNADCRPSLQDIGAFGISGYCSCDAPDGRSDCCTCDQGYVLLRDPLESSDA